MIPVRPFTRESALRYGVYYAARLLPHPWLRSGITAVIRWCINLLQRDAGKSLPSALALTAMNTLRETGMTVVPSPLSAVQIEEIHAFLATAPVAHGRREPVTDRSEGISSAVYDAPTILACPHLLRAINHPDLLQVAAGFLGCKPTISGVGLRWSFPDDKAVLDVQRFHRDTEDWKILRLFIYLTDVFEDCGPHQFVTRSHKTAGRLRLRPYSELDIEQRFGRDKVATIEGPKGTAFMGNMWGIHRGVPPARRPRLLFNCTYTMTATPIYRYQPVEVPDRDLYDRYTNRLLIC